MYRETESLILGAGLVGTLISTELEKRNSEFLVIDVGDQQQHLIDNTKIETNIEVVGNKFRHSLYREKSSPWGRGCMVIPPSELRDEDNFLNSESLLGSIKKISKWMGITDFNLYKSYEINGNNFIKTQYAPRNKNDKNFNPLKKNVLLGHMATKIRVSDKSYLVELTDLKNGERSLIKTKIIIIALGTWEIARLLLNSSDLGTFGKVGKMSFTDHISIESGLFEIPLRNFNHPLGINDKKIKNQNRLYHKPRIEEPNPQGAVSFLEPSGRKETLTNKVIRKVLQNPVCVGEVAAKTMIETGKNDCLELSLTKDSATSIRGLQITYEVSNQTNELLKEKAEEFKSLLQEIGINPRQSLESSIENCKIYDSLHPSSLLRVSDNPEEGELNLNLSINGHENVYCVSSAVLPRAYSVQPTLTILGLADLTVNNLISS